MVDGLNQSHAARGFGVPTLGMHKHAKRIKEGVHQAGLPQEIGYTVTPVENMLFPIRFHYFWTTDNWYIHDVQRAGFNP